MKMVAVSPLLRAIILYDLIVTACLALPGISQLFLQIIDLLGRYTGLAAPLPDFDPFQMFMVNLAGVMGVAWNGLRWKTPVYRLVRFDAWARLAVAALILYYVLLWDVTPVLLLFVFSELFGSVVEFRLKPLP